MKITLHIGTEKTGTTALQKALFNSRGALAEHGILVPISTGGDNHTALTAYSLSDAKSDTIRMLHHVYNQEQTLEFRGQLSRNLRAEIDSWPYNHMVLSNEHCSSRLQEHSEIQRLRDFLFFFSPEIEVVVYLRRQDEFLVSSYSTAVRSGMTDELVWPDATDVAERFDYAKLLDRWSNVFGRDAMTVRLYEREALLDGNIVPDFCAATGLPFLPMANDPSVNQSLDASKLAFMKALNEYLPIVVDDKLTPHRGDISELLDMIPNSGPAIDPPPFADDFMASFHESNGLVADHYFAKRMPAGDPLFGPPKPQRSRGICGIGRTSFELFAELWKLKVAQVAELQDQIQRLES